MVRCSCGKAIEKIPDWMAEIKVEFICNNCPNRQTKNIAFINFDEALHASAKLDEGAEPETEAAAEPEVEAEAVEAEA